VLLRLDPVRARRFRAELQKAPDLVSELGQGAVFV
jgi:hypothetical protein